MHSPALDSNMFDYVLEGVIHAASTRTFRKHTISHASEKADLQKLAAAAIVCQVVANGCGLTASLQLAMFGGAQFPK